MAILRYEDKTTDQNADAIIAFINDDNTNRVIFFASPTQRMQADANLPLLSAFAEYEIPGIGAIQVIFDGDHFLTAARKPRYLEVKSVLDCAESSGKAFFATDRVNFTSKMSPEDAAKTLSSVQNLVQLTSSTRKNISACCQIYQRNNIHKGITLRSSGTRLVGAVLKVCYFFSFGGFANLP